MSTLSVINYMQAQKLANQLPLVVRGCWESVLARYLVIGYPIPTKTVPKLLLLCR